MPRNSGHLECIYSLTHRRIWVRRLVPMLAACARCAGEVSAGPEGHVSGGAVTEGREALPRTRAPASTDSSHPLHIPAREQMPRNSGHLECICSLTHRRIWVRRLVPTLAACARCAGEVSAGPEGHVSGGAVTGSLRTRGPASIDSSHPLHFPRARGQMPRNSGHLECVCSLTHRRIWVRRLCWRRVRGVPARFRPDPKGTCPGER